MVHFSTYAIYLSEFIELVGNQLTQPVKVHKRATAKQGVKGKQMNTHLCKTKMSKIKLIKAPRNLNKNTLVAYM